MILPTFHLRRLLIIGCEFLLVFKLAAQEVRVESSIRRAYSPEEKERLFEQALAVFSDERIPPSYRERLASVLPQPCPTVLLMDVRSNLENFDSDQQAVLRPLLARPSLPLNLVSSSGQFKIHYADAGIHAVPKADGNGNNIPDFVEEAARAFDESHDLQVNVLGYRVAPADNGIDGPEYDVYIQSLGTQSYGFTQGEAAIPQTPQNDFTSYIVIDNDFENDHFTTGIDGARVTAAHEYFHAVQFGYRLFANTEEPFYYEMCSTWMEDVVYDDINDYFQYLPVYFRRTEIPFNHFDRFLHAYGQAVWNHFVVKFFDDIDVVRRSWEIMQTNQLAVSAIDRSLQEKGSSFKDAMAEFAFWNFFTGPNRANADRYYEEGIDYPEVKLNGDFLIESDTTIVDSSLSLTTRYFRFTTTAAGEYAITGAVDDPGNWRFGVVVNGPGVDDLYLFNIHNGQNLGFLPAFTEIVVMPINLLILDGPDLPRLNSRYSRFQFNLIRGVIDPGKGRGITDVSRSPFIIGRHPIVTFSYLPANTTNLEVRILTADGRVIKTAKFSDGSNSLTPFSFSWDGRDDDNAPVASGIYLFVLKQDDFVDIKKFAVIRQ